MSKKKKGDVDEIYDQPIDGESKILGRELDEMRKLADERLSLAQYMKAEFENYKRKTKESNAQAYLDGKRDATLEFFPIIDDLSQALKTLDGHVAQSGIDIVARKFGNVLAGLGVVELDVKKGDTFDPNIHYAVMAEEAKGVEPDTILEVWAKGYRLEGGRNEIIRFPQVKISK
ncbi:MAG: nucleotide exchange factor GrpE [Firmicutes bacterium]|nr:nucleotide exchange factor GrpE [Bacillota bacterium]